MAFSELSCLIIPFMALWIFFIRPCKSSLYGLSWNTNLPSSFRSGTVRCQKKIIPQISGWVPIRGEIDNRFWRMEPSKSFSVKALYQLENFGGVSDLACSALWGC